MRFLAAFTLIMMATTAQADLRDETTQSLLSEVGRRIDVLLGNGGGGGDTGDVILDYRCDTNGRLYFEAISENNTARMDVYFGDTTKCNEQKAHLENLGQMDASFKLLTYCDLYRLYTVKVTRGPEFTAHNNVYYGDYSSCVANL